MALDGTCWKSELRDELNGGCWTWLITLTTGILGYVSQNNQ